MENERNPYVYFKAAFEYEMTHNWKKKHKILSGMTDISVPMISQILHDKKKAGIENAGKIASAMGYTFEEFFAFGRSLVEKKEKPDNPKPKTNGKVLEFPVEFKPPPDDRLIKAQANLKTIFEHGDDNLKSAIEMNLISFKTTVELQIQMAQKNADIKSLREEIDSLKKTVNGPGG